MAQVSLQINGYGYILGCADGEEEHLRALAADLDRRIDEIKASTGPSGEARMLLMAALVVSDELHDLREQSKQRDDDAGASKPEPKTGRRLRGLAKRAEGIADSAEALPLSPSPAESASEPPSSDASPAASPAAPASESSASSSGASPSSGTTSSSGATPSLGATPSSGTTPSPGASDPAP